MNKADIARLKQPAKNRGLRLKDLNNGKIILNGKTFEFMTVAEDYLIKIKRIDI